MATTNCELCGRVIPAAEPYTGGLLKSYCGCDRQPKRTRTQNLALTPDATGRLPDDAPLCKIGPVLRVMVQVMAVPFLCVIYCAAGLPLCGRQACHLVVVWCDMLFDAVATVAGWDAKYWPLPKASDQRLPWKQEVQE